MYSSNTEHKRYYSLLLILHWHCSSPLILFPQHWHYTGTDTDTCRPLGQHLKGTGSIRGTSLYITGTDASRSKTALKTSSYQVIRLFSSSSLLYSSSPLIFVFNHPWYDTRRYSTVYSHGLWALYKPLRSASFFAYTCSLSYLSLISLFLSSLLFFSLNSTLSNSTPLFPHHCTPHCSIPHHTTPHQAVRISAL